MDNALRERLLDMQQEDIATRRRLIEAGQLYGPHLPKDYYNPEMAAVHRRNNAAMWEIVEQYGWPGRGLVGEDGCEAAWQIVQHAILDPELRDRCLPLLEAAYEVGDATGQQVAMLTDSILMQKGQPQIYGSIFVGGSEGKLVPWTIAEPESVDERRAAMGLPPLAERTNVLQQRVDLEKKFQQSAHPDILAEEMTTNLKGS